MLILLLFKKMDKKESTKKYYYDVIPSYNIKGTLLYSSDIKYEIEAFYAARDYSATELNSLYTQYCM